jgi:hypothetical protein
VEDVDLPPISHNTQLNGLTRGANHHTNLNIAQNKFLERLGCGDNGLQKLEVFENTDLFGLLFCGNQLVNIDVTNYPNLEYLGLGRTRITKLDISKNKG